jgi:hypothetical protein
VNWCRAGFEGAPSIFGRLRAENKVAFGARWRRWRNRIVDSSTRSGLLGVSTPIFKRVPGDNMKLLRPIIISHIEQIAAQQKQKLAPLVDDLVLADSGLDSLSFAILVARLEDEFGLDPFTASRDTHYPITLGDFVKFYEHASQRH